MKAKVTATLLAIIIFMGGMAGGILLDRLCLEKSSTSHQKHFKKFLGPKRFDQIQKHLQEKFTKRLELSLEQQGSLKEILQERMAVMKKQAKVHDQEMESLKEITRQQIREILTSDQKEVFQKMVEEYQARKQKRKK